MSIGGRNVRMKLLLEQNEEAVAKISLGTS